MEFGGSLVVVVFYVPTYIQYYSTVQYCTVLLYMCSKQEHKADHRHKKGHSPRAQEGHSFTGISRPRTEVLRTRAYFFAANTLLRSRASRGHLNLSFSKCVRSDSNCVEMRHHPKTTHHYPYFFLLKRKTSKRNYANE